MNRTIIYQYNIFSKNINKQRSLKNKYNKYQERYKVKLFALLQLNKACQAKGIPQSYWRYTKLNKLMFNVKYFIPKGKFSSFEYVIL